jgi:HJR/Mrr/RecB family endonuclease
MSTWQAMLETGVPAFVWMFRLIFDFWPLLFLGAIRGVLEGRGNVLRPLAAFVVMIGFVRVFIEFLAPLAPTGSGIGIIPEPLNTMAFALVGAGILLLWFSWEIIKRGWFRRTTGQINTIAAIVELSPTQFEDMVADLYRIAGHSAKRTGRSGDHGVDVVVHAKNGEKWVVQCKRWRGGTVGEPLVRDFYGAMQHEKADRGIIITTARFSVAAQRWARGKSLDLYDGEKLLSLWRRAQATKRKQLAKSVGAAS